MRKFLYLLALLPGLALADPWTLSWDPVTTAVDGTTLTEQPTYNVYLSPGCGQKALATTTQATSVTVNISPGCTSAAVSASNSFGEGPISSTITKTLAAPKPTSPPSQVKNLKG